MQNWGINSTFFIPLCCLIAGFARLYLFTADKVVLVKTFNDQVRLTLLHVMHRVFLFSPGRAIFTPCEGPSLQETK